MPYAVAKDSVRLHYEEAGSGLPPMLLVHCWCCDYGYMTPQFEHFGRCAKSRLDAFQFIIRLHGQAKLKKTFSGS